MARPNLPVCELVLVGGGHAHLRVLERFARKPMAGVRLTLVSDEAYVVYRGRLTEFLAGRCSREDSHFDLRALTRAAGARFIESEAMAFDLAESGVRFTSEAEAAVARAPIGFDLLSLNLGSLPEIPIGARDAASSLRSKPVNQFLRAWAELERAIASRPGVTSYELAIVGGGSAGVELALVAARKFRAQGVKVSLFQRGPDLLPHHAPGVRRRMAKYLAELAVVTHLNEAVVDAGAFQLRGESGQTYPIDQAIWFTDPVAPAAIRAASLSTDARGFLLVDPGLRSVSHARVFGAGGCAQPGKGEWPRNLAATLAQGEVLAENLARAVSAWQKVVSLAGGAVGADAVQTALAETSLRSYRPARAGMNWLTVGEKNAVASWGGWVFSGGTMAKLKERGDRRFMQRYSLERDAKLFREPPRVPGGADSKVGQAALDRVLERIGILDRPEVLRGTKSTVDRLGTGEPFAAGTFRRSEVSVVETVAGKALVQSVELLPSIFDDAYLLGRIATLHSLSKHYAVGADPVSALALAQVSVASERDAEEELFQLMSGCAFELRAAKVALAGGRSLQGAGAAFGLSVQGFGYAQRLRGVSGLRPQDHLILTQALGTGVILAAHAVGRAKGEWVDRAIEAMLLSNAKASDILRAGGISACTHVAGFGLLGSLLEMLQASQFRAVVKFDSIPHLTGAFDAFRAGVLSRLDPENRRLGSAIGSWGGVARLSESALLFDPQTSGGLLLGCRPEASAALLHALWDAGYRDACKIGEVMSDPAAGAVGWVELES